jgi:hypothetical protein
MSGLLQRRYRVSRATARITGVVENARHPARVDAFQASEKWFDVMILSPRAGGVETRPASESVAGLPRNLQLCVTNRVAGLL